MDETPAEGRLAPISVADLRAEHVVLFAEDWRTIVTELTTSLIASVPDSNLTNASATLSLQELLPPGVQVPHPPAWAARVRSPRSSCQQVVTRSLCPAL